MYKLKIILTFIWQILNWFAFAIMFKYYWITSISKRSDLAILMVIITWFVIINWIKILINNYKKNGMMIWQSPRSQKNGSNNG